MDVDIVVGILGAWFTAAGVLTLALGRAASRSCSFRVENETPQRLIGV